MFGGDAESVFNHIKCLLSRFESKYCVCCTVSYNARIGNETDIIEDIDDVILERKYIDSIITDHGKSLLHFLIDNSMCILNGRCESDSNKYTSVSTEVVQLSITFLLDKMIYNLYEISI